MDKLVLLNNRLDTLPRNQSPKKERKERKKEIIFKNSMLAHNFSKALGRKLLNLRMDMVMVVTMKHSRIE